MAEPQENLHTRTTRALALRVMAMDDGAAVLPNEAELCRELGVSRTVVRESIKVLANKGLVEVRTRTGTRARPRSQWRLLDPEVLSWRAEVRPDAAFLRDLCEVRLAIEPIAAGFAALRASAAELDAMEGCLRRYESAGRQAGNGAAIDLDLAFHRAVVAASGNPLLLELSDSIRQPFRNVLSCTSRYPANRQLGRDAHAELLAALQRRDPLAARAASEKIVGLAMIAVEQVIRRRGAPRKERT
jgi:GntR family transcriptional regulator, galactonate operon transcriptional repressor